MVPLTDNRKTNISNSSNNIFTCELFLFGAEIGHCSSAGCKQGFSWYAVVIPACKNNYK